MIGEKRRAMEKDLLFYNEYEQFYLMAKKSKAFRLFCEKAFGMDFSQDGFSDISQTDSLRRGHRSVRHRQPEPHP